MITTIGIDIGSGAVKTVLFRGEQWRDKTRRYVSLTE